MLIIYFISAALSSKNKDLGKERLNKFENEAGRKNADTESQIAILKADALIEQTVIFRKFFFLINNCFLYFKNREDDDAADETTSKGTK